jgi:hypothetical protein
MRALPASALLRALPALCVAILIASAGCSSGGGTPLPGPTGASGTIVLSPLGSAASPAPESIYSTFTLTASESGYSGNFTAQTIAGMCWVVQAPTSAPSTFVVKAAGSLCVGAGGGIVDQIQVSDTLGHSAITYILSI